MLRPSTGLSQPLIALYSDALPGAKRRSRGAGSCVAGKLTGIAEASPGVYQLSATDAASLSKELNGITFSGVSGTADQQVQFSLKVTDDHGLSSVDNTTSVTVPGTPLVTQQPPQVAPNFNVRDVTTNQTSSTYVDGPCSATTFRLSCKLSAHALIPAAAANGIEGRHQSRP
jgi:hypothetical protein